MKTTDSDVGTLIEAVKAISEIGSELSVPNIPLPECNGCKYRMVDLSEKRHECFYSYIEQSSSNCKVKGYENKTTIATLL